MAFFAETAEGEEVNALEVSNERKVYCPGCGKELYYRQSHTRAGSHVSSHFCHLPGTQDCGWRGESDEHKMMKWKAASWVLEIGAVTDVEVESQVGDRRADVLGRIEQPTSPWGKGVVVEAQYKNDGKDIEAVEQEYLDAGYSVCWLWEDDFTEYGVSYLDPVEKATTVWPNAVPDTGDAASAYPDFLAPDPAPTATFPMVWFDDAVKEAVERGRLKGGHADGAVHLYILGEYNADRVCVKCGNEAIAYEHGVGFQCRDCAAVGKGTTLAGHSDRIETP